MDPAVAIVEAYLQINGYFTVAEYPVIEARPGHGYTMATDLDILAFRFPGAGRLVHGADGVMQFEPDPALCIAGNEPDMLIGEVKEGKAVLNNAARDPAVLSTALLRFGCCSPGHVQKTVNELVRDGRTMTHCGHRVRLVAFGSKASGPRSKHYTRLSLAHVTSFLDSYLQEYWSALRHAQFKHPGLGFLMLMKKAAIEAERSK